MTPRRVLLLHPALALLLSVTLGAAPAWSQRVGTTGAVNPSSTGTPPGGSGRTLELGADVVYQERIQTTGSGSLQVLFVDRTTLSVGPNSDITIDEFVYNPNAGSGTFAATVAKGSFRFVGGQISRTAGATIRTPVATLGIRGTVISGEVQGPGCTRQSLRTGTDRCDLKVSNFQGSVSVRFSDGRSVSVPPGSKVTFDGSTGQVQQSSITGADVTTLPGTTLDESTNPADTGPPTDTVQTETDFGSAAERVDNIAPESRTVDSSQPEPSDNFGQPEPPQPPTPLGPDAPEPPPQPPPFLLQ